MPAKLIVKPGTGHDWLTMLEDLPPMADWFDKYLAREKADKQARQTP